VFTTACAICGSFISTYSISVSSIR
jgi:hypothetical protein